MSLNGVGFNSLAELGQRIARHRLNQNLTQEDLAKKAGVGSATVKRIEHGSASTQLVNFINVLRALGLDQNLEALVPEVPPSPVQIVNVQKKSARQRARKKNNIALSSESPTWTWDDD